METKDTDSKGATSTEHLLKDASESANKCKNYNS